MLLLAGGKSPPSITRKAGNSLGWEQRLDIRPGKMLEPNHKDTGSQQLPNQAWME